jgi:hypothetical protein
MTTIEARNTLLDCFLALPDEELANLAHHERVKTPILCGEESYRFADGKGGA